MAICIHRRFIRCEDRNSKSHPALRETLLYELRHWVREIYLTFANPMRERCTFVIRHRSCSPMVRILSTCRIFFFSIPRSAWSKPQRNRERRCKGDARHDPRVATPAAALALRLRVRVTATLPREPILLLSGDIPKRQDALDAHCDRVCALLVAGERDQLWHVRFCGRVNRRDA